MDYGDTISTAAYAFQNNDIDTVYSLYAKSIPCGHRGQLIRDTIDHMTRIYYPNFDSLKELIEHRDKKELVRLYQTDREQLYKRLQLKQQASLYLTLSLEDGYLLYTAVVHAPLNKLNVLSKVKFNQNTIDEYIHECVSNRDSYSYKILLSYYKNIKQCIPMYQSETLTQGLLDVLLDDNISKGRKKNIVAALNKELVLSLVDKLDFKHKVQIAKYISRMKLKSVFASLDADMQYALLYWRLKRSSSLREKFKEKGTLKYGDVTLTMNEYKKYF